MPAPPVPKPDLPAGREWLRWYTCVACGARHASWAAFRSHRAACRRRDAAGPRPDPDGVRVAAAPPEVGWPAGAPAAEEGPESVP